MEKELNSKELQDHIQEFVCDSGIDVSCDVVEKVVEVLEFLSRYGLRSPVKIEPLPGGGIRVKLDGPFVRADLDLYKEKKAELYIYLKNSEKLIARFDGEILI